MKTVLRSWMLLAAVIMSMSSLAQVPQKMNYQAVARNSSGTPITNHLIGIKFTIRETSAFGPDIFAETMTATTNSMGTFSVEIGGGTAVLGSFATIPWSTGAKYLNIKIDPNGGTTYTDMGTYQLLSVAYAQFAKNVMNNDDADASPTNELQNLSIAGNQLSISNGNTVTIPADSDNWGTQVVITDATLTGNGLTGTPLKLAQQGATNGQVLKWNGTTWLPGTDNTGGGSTTPGGADGSIQFNSSGSFAGDNNLFWDNTNKRIGLGTTTPEFKLDVLNNSMYLARFKSTAGTALINLNALNGGSYLIFNNNGIANWGLGNTDNDDFIIYQPNISDGFRIEHNTNNVITTGRVGIVPFINGPIGALLEVRGNSSTTDPHLLLNETESDYARIGFKNTTLTGINWQLGGILDATDYNSKLKMIYTDGANVKDILTVTGSGAVGINNSAPDQKLSIWGAGSATSAGFKNNATSEGPGNGLSVGIYSNGKGFITQYENLSLTLGTNAVDRITITADGKVGIGTNTPVGLLDIYGGGSGLSYPSIKIANPNAAGIAAWLINTGTDATEVVTNNNGASGGNAIFAKYFDGSSGDLIRFDNYGSAHSGRIFLYGNNNGTQSGGVLFGSNNYGLITASILNGSLTAITETRAPSASEKVFEPFITGDTKLGSSTYKWKEVWATNGTIQTSDERDKQNVQPLTSGLNAVMQLKPVSFQWKNQNSRVGSGTNLGFIAQDLEKVIPDAVVHVITPQQEIDDARAAGKGDLPADVYGVKYAEIVPVLVKAIQDQQELMQDQNVKIQSQEELIENQQQTINELLKRVNKLEGK